MSSQPPHLVLFFTFDVSLEVWKDTGLLSREVALYQRLIEKGWQVTFVTYGGRRDLEIAKEIAPIKVIALYKEKPPTRVIVRLLQSPFLVWRARNCLQKADVYKTNQIWGGWNAVLAKFFYKRPLIARGGYEPYSFSIFQKHSKLRQWLTKVTSGWVYSKAEAIFMATQEDAQFIVDNFKVDSGKIHIRKNWVDTDLFTSQPAQRDSSEILFVGRMTRQKNLENLFQALKGSSYRLHLVGGGELKESLKVLADEIGIKTVFHGRLANDQLAAFISSFHVFVLPSLFEGNPKVLLEAMSCGRAIVGTKVPGIENLLEDRKNALMCETDSHSLRKALDELCSNAELRNHLGGEARKHIEKTASLSAYVKDELIFLDKLIYKDG